MTTKNPIHSKVNYFLRYRIAMWACLFALGIISAVVATLLYGVMIEKLTLLNIIVILLMIGILCLPIRYFWKEAIEFKNKSNWYYLFNGGKIEIPVNIIYTKPRLRK